MESHVHNSLWHLLRADSDEAQRARRRLGVGIACAVFLGGLLTAIGFVVVVLALSLSVVVIVATAAGVRALRRHRNELSAFGRSAATRAERTFRQVHARARRFSVAALAAGTSAGRGFGRSATTHAGRTSRQLDARARQLDARARQLMQSAAVKAREARGPSRPRNIDLQREALRLNAAGTQRRRDGAPDEAVRLHSQALEILRGAEDPHATALVQNNLALALSHVGDDRRATTLFEQAAATVRALGDDEHEGRIMANLAIAHRRHGRVDECDDILRTALTKLRRDSSAYKRVEAELARAGAQHN
jgi:tetratricopeptide (TPR) repeat protein